MRYISKRGAMRRFFTLLLALAFALSARAEGEEQLLRRVVEYVKVLGSYDAAVDVSAGDYKASGSYSVAGDSYYIIVGEAEVYADRHFFFICGILLLLLHLFYAT